MDVDDADLAALRALQKWIELILNAEACKERLAELEQEQTATSHLIDVNTQLLADAEAAKAAAETMLVDIKGQREAAEANMRAAELRTKQNTVRSTALDEREQALNVREDNLKFREQHVGEQENTAQHREIAVAEREAAAEEKARQADSLKADYETRIKRLVATAAGSELAEVV